MLRPPIQSASIPTGTTTQPVSGTVTANAGQISIHRFSHWKPAAISRRLPAPFRRPKVNVNISSGTAAATQSGTWTNTVTQATAASLNATVVGTGTFAVQAAQSGTWNIGTVTTVSAVTAISNALPAGTNLLGSIAQSPQIASAYNGTTAATVQYASFSTSSSGATTIVSAVGGKKVYVLRWSVSSSNGNTNVNLQSHTTTSNATGVALPDPVRQRRRSLTRPLGIMATTTGRIRPGRQQFGGGRDLRRNHLRAILTVAVHCSQQPGHGRRLGLGARLGDRPVSGRLGRLRS